MGEVTEYLLSILGPSLLSEDFIFIWSHASTHPPKSNSYATPSVKPALIVPV